MVMPGGGYQFLATNHEGRQVANWLNALHLTAFVLKYRVGPRYHHPVEMEDAQRAIRLVRLRAKEFNIRRDRLGVMAFSAGGHLASITGTHFDAGNPGAAGPVDRVSSRPDFLIPAYPVISFTADYSHKGSVKALLGDNASPALLKELSNEFQVTAETPPTFIFSTNVDTGVPSENSVAFYLALRKAGVSAEMRIFEKGPHGVGLDLADPALERMAHLACKLAARERVAPGLKSALSLACQANRAASQHQYAEAAFDAVPLFAVLESRSGEATR